MADSQRLARRMTAALLRAWEHRGLLAVVLLPVALVYALLVACRRLAYAQGWLPVKSVSCAVVVVGNAVAGGAGKTPTTIGIVRHLRKRGMAVGVVSRGYGRADTAVRSVAPNDDANVVGDEPVLIARATGAPVFVGRDRPAAALTLLKAHPDTQVIVCDDGLQHYALHRDVEICVFDDRGIGNGWLLPAGPLREPWPREAPHVPGTAAPKSLVLHTGSSPRFSGYTAQRRLSAQAVGANGQTVELAAVQGPLLALAGIARPAVFFEGLRAMGIPLEKTLALPDHYDFSTLDTRILQGWQVLCTEKDAVKLWKEWPHALAVPLVQTLEPAFLQALDGMLDSVLAAKLSSRHGHQTT